MTFLHSSDFSEKADLSLVERKRAHSSAFKTANLEDDHDFELAMLPNTSSMHCDSIGKHHTAGSD